MDLQINTITLKDRYPVRGRIGAGSYAEIFIARDLQSQAQEVVIKALNPYLQGPPDAALEQALYDNFEKEQAILTALSHPNIIPCLDAGRADDLNGREFRYIVVEYLPGGDLLHLSRSHPSLALNLSDVIFYFQQICAALEHAHGKGIIHRDLKPNNILLSADRRVVKVADFGVAKIATQEIAEITRVGTDCYSPPEHSPKATTGTVGILTASADIYSLAKSCFAVLCGRSPAEFAGQPITALPPPIQSQTWAKSLLDVLRRATQTEIEKRYGSIVEFWQDLAQVGIHVSQESAALKAKRQTPEEIELNKKRAELFTLESILAQRELDLATLQAELREFEGEYLRRVGVLYGELDEIEAKIAETQAAQAPEDAAAQRRAQAARAQANESASTAQEGLSESSGKFKPSETMKRLYRELARLIHPDLVADESEKLRRHTLMAEANRAYEQGDESRLTTLLSDWQDSPDTVKGEGVALELVRSIRKISQAEKRIAEINSEIVSLNNSELNQLRMKVDKAAMEGRDLLDEMAALIEEQIEDAQERWEDEVQTRVRND